jgi:hypothetical protein
MPPVETSGRKFTMRVCKEVQRPGRPAGTTAMKATSVKDSSIAWQYRVVLSAVAAASLNLSGIFIGSGMPMVGFVAAAFGAFTLGVLTAMSS